MQLTQLTIWCLAYISVSVAAYTNEELFAKRAQYPSGIIPITSDDFHQFFNGPKDHHLITLFTTSNEQFNCAPCAAFAPVYETISNSFIRDYAQKPVFFTVVEFEDNVEHYRNLQLNTVPHIWIYPPYEARQESGDEEEEDVKIEIIDVTSPHYVYQVPETLLDPSSKNELELNFGNYLSSILHLNIIIQQPLQLEAFLKHFIAYLAVFVIIKRRGRKILDKFNSFHFYFLVSTALIFLSISGYNFCVQRSVPFIAKDSQGGIMYFSGGYQYQFGLEMVNITSVYTVFTGLMVVLVTFAPNLKNLPLQTALNLISAVAVFVMYHLLNTIFHIKDPSYPFVTWQLF